jgi:YHS domain-containing protein
MNQSTNTCCATDLLHRATDVDPTGAPKSVLDRTSYYFCDQDETKAFDTAPANSVAAEQRP